MKRWFAALLISVLGFTSVAARAASRCENAAPLVSADSKKISIEAIRALPKDISASEIVHALGPAARDVGSGLHVLQWDTSSNQVFSISVASPCSLPLRRILSPRTGRQQH